MNNNYEKIENEYNNMINRNEKVFDYIVITVSNNQQKKIVEEEVNRRLSKNMLLKNSKYLVIPDYNNERIGSGGALLNVMRILRQNENIDWSKNKVLLINSGGECRRVAQYSYAGKIFIPLLEESKDGARKILLDNILAYSNVLGKKIENGILITTSDCLFTFDIHELKEINSTSAISSSENKEKGTVHGVLVKDKESNKLNKFLHKQPLDILEKENAIIENEKVELDTGIIYIDSILCKNIFKIICKDDKFSKEKFDGIVNSDVRLNFYGDLIYPLAKLSTFEQYIKESSEGEKKEQIRKVKAEIWKNISNLDMNVISIKTGHFTHLGTNIELSNNLKCNENTEKNLRYHNSYIDSLATIGKNCYIENSKILGKSRIGENSMVFNTNLVDETIPENTIVQTVRMKNGNLVTKKFKITEKFNNKECIWNLNEIDYSYFKESERNNYDK